MRGDLEDMRMSWFRCQMMTDIDVSTGGPSQRSRDAMNGPCGTGHGSKCHLDGRCPYFVNCQEGEYRRLKALEEAGT